MKTMIKGVLALALVASTAGAALAQDNGEHRRANRDDGGYNPAMRASNRNVPPSLQQQQPAPQAQTQAPSQPQSQGQSWRNGQGGRRGDDSGRSGQQAQQPSGQRWNNGQSWQGQNTNQGQRHDDHRNDRNDQRWNNGGSSHWNNGSNNNGWNNNGRDWRPDRNQQRPRYDRQHYGHNYRSQQRYRGYAYRPPSGFYIRSWSYGDLLPRSWWSSQYRLNDWWSYGLPIPPIGYEYVRVGDDVLLVDMFSGRVVQVIYDVFW